MNQIDYELGLVRKGEEFDNAGGEGIAMAVLTACNTKCNIMRRNKTKRQWCKNRCTKAYNDKMNLINVALAQQSGNVATAVVPVPKKTTYTSSEMDALLEKEGVTVISDTSNGDKTVVEEKPAGMSTGMKIGIGVAALALIGGVIYFVRKKKSA